MRRGSPKSRRRGKMLVRSAENIEKEAMEELHSSLHAHLTQQAELCCYGNSTVEKNPASLDMAFKKWRTTITVGWQKVSVRGVSLRQLEPRTLRMCMILRLKPLNKIICCFQTVQTHITTDPIRIRPSVTTFVIIPVTSLTTPCPTVLVGKGAEGGEGGGGGGGVGVEGGGVCSVGRGFWEKSPSMQRGVALPWSTHPKDMSFCQSHPPHIISSNICSSLVQCHPPISFPEVFLTWR